MKNKLNKNQYEMLMNLPIRYCYKHKIKHICEKRNLRVESFLDYLLKIYFLDLEVFDNTLKELCL